MIRNVTFAEILAKRKTNDAANAGFLAGFISGLIQALFDVFIIIWFKKIVLKEFILIKEQFGMLIPYDINTLYILTLFTAPLAIIFLYLVAGIIFGLIFNRFKRKTSYKAIGLSFLFGLGFGIITNLPINKLLIIAANIATWLLFSFLFLKFYIRNKCKENKEQIKGKTIAVFLLVLFILSLSMTLFSYYLRIKLSLLASLYMFTPLIATFITCYIYRIPFTSLGLSVKLNRWYLIAWLLPTLLSFSSIAISLLFPGVTYTINPEDLSGYRILINTYIPTHLLLYLIFLGLIAGPTINTLFAFGEEIAWRGFLQKELNYLGFWKYSFLIGVIWGFWHAPLIVQGYNYPQHHLIGIFFMVIFCILLSPILSYIRIKSQSVIATAIMHGSINAFAGIPIIFTKGSDLIIGLQGLSGFIVLIIINLYLFSLFRKIKENNRILKKRRIIKNF